MNIKTSKNLVSALKGSAFRKISYDARSWFLRKIKTVGDLQRQAKL